MVGGIGYDHKGVKRDERYEKQFKAYLRQLARYLKEKDDINYTAALTAAKKSVWLRGHKYRDNQSRDAIERLEKQRLTKLEAGDKQTWVQLLHNIDRRCRDNKAWNLLQPLSPFKGMFVAFLHFRGPDYARLDSDLEPFLTAVLPRKYEKALKKGGWTVYILAFPLPKRNKVTFVKAGLE